MEEEIILRFRKSGGGYARAKEVAVFMDMEIEEYLLNCIKQGHQTFQSVMNAELELPAFIRAGPRED